MRVRYATDSDIVPIAALFTEAVHKIASGSYSRVQIIAWAPEPPDVKQWKARLENLETLVADFDGEIGGFISYENTGHIEFLYTLPTYSRKGIASKLFSEATNALRLSGVTQFFTEASLEAKPFFERKGFRVVEEQTVERNGISLKRYAMKSG